MVVAARPDVVAAVIAQLRASTEITALTSTRITARLQPSWTGMPTYAILVRATGGLPGKPHLNLMETSFTVLCFGATEALAAALWRQFDAVFCPGQERKAQFVQGSCRVGTVVRDGMPDSGIEPGTEWPRTRSFYLVRWMGVAI